MRSLRLGRSIHLTARLGGEERRTSDEGRSYVVAQGRRGWDESAGLFRQPWRRNAAGRREACGSQIGSGAGWHSPGGSARFAVGTLRWRVPTAPSTGTRDDGGKVRSSNTRDIPRRGRSASVGLHQAARGPDRGQAARRGADHGVRARHP